MRPLSPQRPCLNPPLDSTARRSRVAYALLASSLTCSLPSLSPPPPAYFPVLTAGAFERRTRALMATPKAVRASATGSLLHQAGEKSPPAFARGAASPKRRATAARAFGARIAGRAKATSIPTTPVKARMLFRTHLF